MTSPRTGTLTKYLPEGLLVAVFVVLAGTSWLSTEWMRFLFEGVSYPIIFLLMLLWLASAVRLARCLGVAPADVLRRCRPGAALALLVTAVVFATVETGFRTLSDETNLLAVSRAMLFEKSVHNITTGKYYFDNFHALDSELPKRPLVYPFLTSILHSLGGFHPENAFVVNYATFFLFLTGVFCLTRRYVDAAAATAAVLLIAGYPIVTLYVASGGFDFVNAALFYLAFASLWFFLLNPSRQKFEFMWMTFLVLSNVRYESVIYFAVAVAGLTAFRYINRRTFGAHATLFCATPLLMLPFFWQRVLSSGRYQNAQDQALFSVENFLRHLREYLVAQVDFAFYLPYANVVSLLALAGVVALAAGLFAARNRDRVPKPVRRFAVIFGAAMLVHLTLVLSHFFGRYTHPSSARFFIISSIFLALVPVWLLKLYPGRLRSTELLAVAAIVFLLYHPIAIDDRFTDTLALNREFRQTRRFVDSLDDRRILVVTDRPGQFTALGYGAVRFGYARRHADALLNELERGLYSTIVVLQRIDYADYQPMSGFALPPQFRLREVERVQVKGSFMVSISLVRPGEPD